MKQEQGADAWIHLLSGTSCRHDAAEAPAPTKGCAAFWVGAEDEAPQRVAVPVALLGHPRILELLGEAKEEYGYAHQGAVVVPCGAKRFQQAIDAAKADGRHRHHHHHLGLPHFLACFRPSHAVATAVSKNWRPWCKMQYGALDKYFYHIISALV